MSLIRRHRERVLAASAVLADPSAAAIQAAVAGGSFLGRRMADALDASGHADTAPRALALAQIMLQLKEDRDRLGNIQSVERKIDLKRELLPRYEAWCQGILDATAGGLPAIQDEVLANTLVWRLDVGDYAGAIPLAAYVLTHGLVLPERFDRQPAVLIAEEVAETAIRELTAGRSFSAEVLDQVAALTAPHDMPDQVRAKLHRASGLELASRVEQLAESGVAGAKAAAVTAALAHLRRALELNPKAGVKKEIERLERELKAAEPAPAPAETTPVPPPASAAATAPADQTPAPAVVFPANDNADHQPVAPVATVEVVAAVDTTTTSDASAPAGDGGAGGE